MKKGFTLAELMMVVAIILILTAVVITSLNSTRQKSRDAIRLEAMKTLSGAAENYFVEHDYKWPQTINDFREYFVDNGLPQDPLGGDYSYAPITDNTGSNVGYKYCLGTKLETLSLANTETCYSGNGNDNYKIKGPAR